ncbi:hypothetical protein BL250_12620 [Erwinia sp. OLTSP20]|nr:hypothetical protein BV501_09130 [Erwinia sp. OAMSP11]PIJ72180.1 hypothetical protein BK416_10030 [Erwinia sp. OLSSP12]PIJ81471.1 hypothetical protein BLD47_08855 [Erwinia sp. OLCASP19]PIJ84177.1 hypothetical protein BLD46_08435 [Erwinia sp. OLMTSP26]PIJ85876.1 hypothetical protein BLD49_09655 [Erwinia sp. OLMDSP33]PIJ91325.1 hypothetical protein BL250_12620 [Erwinia sp. OLTSP20]PIJ92063.1 hypothetical protein BL249_06795 [Erwinia sp. OLFS4]
MQWIEGGEFQMGSEQHYPEERPRQIKQVNGFWMDVTPVTNRQFAEFVSATGYLTEAEKKPCAADFPDVDPALLVPGALVFRSPAAGSQPRDYRDWWFYVAGACWHRPDGIQSLTPDDADKPVVQVAWQDALAYARWAGKTLPTEAEWEYAARGGHDGLPYAWGNEFQPEGKLMANTWQGNFPFSGQPGQGRYFATSPVAAFPANDYGLYDMIGNVWEWTLDTWQPDHSAPARTCCLATRPTGVERQKVVKGGSYLCAPNYCRRYRPAARHPQTTDSATSHIGFRCIRHR